MEKKSPFLHQLTVRKEALKFASAHMTVFPNGTKEALHGHGYTASLQVGVSSIGLQEMIPFEAFKKALKTICDAWDEKVLLAQNCPFFSIRSQTPTETEFVLCSKRYVLPTDEIVLLPVDNITVETLSYEVLRLLQLSLSTIPRYGLITSLEVRVEESPGQGACTKWER